MDNQPFFPVFNSNFFRYMEDPCCEEYEPTLADRLERYCLSPQYQTEKEFLMTKVSMFVLKTLAEIGIVLEISLNLLAWKFISQETWIKINIACLKLTQKMMEYRYGTQLRASTSFRTNEIIDHECDTRRRFERIAADASGRGIKIE